jgi:hypothetical protein
MTDEELCKRLRERGGRIPTEAADRIEELGRLARGQGEQLEIQGNELCRRASHGHKQADRIEALERDAKAHEKEIAVWSENYAAMERKLEAARADTEKAVELLIVCRDMFDEVAHPSDPLSKMLNDTLAEIEGEKK